LSIRLQKITGKIKGYRNAFLGYGHMGL